MNLIAIFVSELLMAAVYITDLSTFIYVRQSQWTVKNVEWFVVQKLFSHTWDSTKNRKLKIWKWK